MTTKSTKSLFLSKHSLVVEDGAQYLIIGLLQRTTVRVDKAIWNDVEAAKFSLSRHDHVELIEHLVDARILVDDTFEPLEYIRQQSAAARCNKEVFGLIVVPTLACNMSCHYCFENKTNRLNRAMSDMDERVIDFARTKLEIPDTKALSLRWFGGEPLIAPKHIERVTRRLQGICNQLGKDFAADIVTNGFFLTPLLAQSLSEVGVKTAQITLEGSKRHHDSIRSHGREGSYERILSNIESCFGLIDVNLRIHVTPEGVEGIQQLLLDLKARSLDKMLKSIYFAPLFDFKQRDPNSQFQAKSSGFLSSEEFASLQATLLKRAIELGFDTKDPLDIDYGVCTALREHTAVIHSDGSLAKCYLDAGDQSEAFGLFDGTITKEANLSKWSMQDFSLDEDCANCAFLPACLGGCSKHRYTNADKRFICTPLKYNAKEVLTAYF